MRIRVCFSALQRAEIAERNKRRMRVVTVEGFSALQRAEIAENWGNLRRSKRMIVSVLFNEPKLLKVVMLGACQSWRQVSVLFNEPKLLKLLVLSVPLFCEPVFQCSSTSRNC